MNGLDWDSGKSLEGLGNLKGPMGKLINDPHDAWKMLPKATNDKFNQGVVYDSLTSPYH